MDSAQLTLLLNTVIAVFLPTLVGLVTTQVTSASTKAVLLLVLSFAQTLIAQVIIALGDGHFDWFTWIITGIGSFVVGVATHFGLWKPTGVSAAAQAAGARE